MVRLTAEERTCKGKEGGGGRGRVEANRNKIVFLIFEHTIFRKEQKLLVAVYLSSAKIFIFQLCVTHFLRCHANRISCMVGSFLYHISEIREFVHLLSI